LKDYHKKKSNSTKKVTEISPNSDGIFQVFCGNLSYKIDESTLISVFEEAGCPFNKVKFITNSDGSFWGSSILDFSSIELAKKAASTLNGIEVLQRPLKVELCRPKTDSKVENNRKQQSNNRERSEKVPGSTTIFIGAVADEATEDTFRELFKDCGKITSFRWVNDASTGQFKGCGFIEFETEDAPDLAIELSGTTVCGRRIRIDYSSTAKKTY